MAQLKFLSMGFPGRESALWPGGDRSDGFDPSDGLGSNSECSAEATTQTLPGRTRGKVDLERVVSHSLVHVGIGPTRRITQRERSILLSRLI